MMDATNASTAPPQKKFTIAVEGNIAAGKSTLLERLQDMPGGAQIVVEPVEKWQTLVPGDDGNIMARMYRDPKRWAYLFQSYVLLTMMDAHETPQTKRLRVMERSVYSARHCFIENLRKSDPPLIDDLEYEVYKQWFNWLMERQPPNVDLIVYLRTTPDTCMDRLKIRGRSEEEDVPMSYLEALHARYEDWLIDNPDQHSDGVPVLVLDGNKDATPENTVAADFCAEIEAKVKSLEEAKQIAAAAAAAAAGAGAAAAVSTAAAAAAAATTTTNATTTAAAGEAQMNPPSTPAGKAKPAPVLGTPSTTKVAPTAALTPETANPPTALITADTGLGPRAELFP